MAVAVAQDRRPREHLQACALSVALSIAAPCEQTHLALLAAMRVGIVLRAARYAQDLCQHP
eukprot:1698566-Alexandrium_andersonii.AAC.1